MESHMSEQSIDPQDRQPAPRRPRRWRTAILGAAVLAVGLTSGFAIGAAQGVPWWILSGGHHGFSAERITAKVDRRVDRVLSRVDATDEQRTQVTQIANAAITDLSNMGIRPWEMRGQFLELLRAETIDPAAFETLRADQIGKADAASKRVVQALTDAAAVLTPEQRRELTDRWQKRMERHRDRHEAK
jgi:periplasmic protein CpxP/Spy